MKPLVVGYKGEIGRFILNGLLEKFDKANDIFCVDINNSRREVVARIKKADTIFLCVPIECTGCWLAEYWKHLKGKLIIEQSSVKGPLYNSKLAKQFKIFSMHILFRPSATPPENRKVAFLYNQPNPNLVRLICSIIKAKPVFFVDHNHHDLMMATNQALVHRVVLTLGYMLSMSEGTTYIDDKILELYNRIKSKLKDNGKYLYGAIQENEFTGQAINEFLREFNSFDIKKHWTVV